MASTPHMERDSIVTTYGTPAADEVGQSWATDADCPRTHPWKRCDEARRTPVEEGHSEAFNLEVELQRLQELAEEARSTAKHAVYERFLEQPISIDFSPELENRLVELVKGAIASAGVARAATPTSAGGYESIRVALAEAKAADFEVNAKRQRDRADAAEEAARVASERAATLARQLSAVETELRRPIEPLRRADGTQTEGTETEMDLSLSRVFIPMSPPRRPPRRRRAPKRNLKLRAREKAAPEKAAPGGRWEGAARVARLSFASILVAYLAVVVIAGLLDFASGAGRGVELIG